MPDRLLIFGSTGMLGQALTREAKARGFEVIGAARKNADIKVDFSQLYDGHVWNAITKVDPDLIINCAAITDHDLCEKDPKLADLVNNQAPKNIAQACNEPWTNIPFTEISTDCFFTGDKDKKHDELDLTTIVNWYARSKRTAENHVLNYNGLVIRTNITGLRGWEKPTFFEWAVKSLLSHEPIKVFTDYYTSTCDTGTVSKAILDLQGQAGLINVASSEVSSKAQFIAALATELGVLCNGTTASVTSLPSKRAESCGLDVSKAEKLLGYELPGLKRVVGNLCATLRNSDLAAAR
jgi:dTDP-4-dehydrorhamnose reductase